MKEEYDRGEFFDYLRNELNDQLKVFSGYLDKQAPRATLRKDEWIKRFIVWNRYRNEIERLSAYTQPTKTEGLKKWEN